MSDKQYWQIMQAYHSLEILIIAITTLQTEHDSADHEAFGALPRLLAYMPQLKVLELSLTKSLMYEGNPFYSYDQVFPRTPMY